MGCEVGCEPLLLGRTFEGLVLANRRIVDVEYDDVPVPQIQAVVAQPPGPCPAAEIVERGVGTPGVVLMVAQRGVGSRLVPAPAGVVAVRVCGLEPSGNTLSPRVKIVPGRVSNTAAVASSLVVPQVAMFPATRITSGGNGGGGSVGVSLPPQATTEKPAATARQKDVQCSR